MINEITNDKIITYLNVDNKMYIAYTNNSEPVDGDEVFFAECSIIDEKNVLLPIISDDILKKVLEKYDEYVNIMENVDEYYEIDEEE